MSKILVFDSNLAGRHGAGAALFARQYCEAKLGVGEGPTGNSYALPTKDYMLRTRSLDDIRASVEKFMAHADEHPETTFYVTKVGCGLAGYKEEDIGPMFCSAPRNCILPEGWREMIPF